MVMVSICKPESVCFSFCLCVKINTSNKNHCMWNLCSAYGTSHFDLIWSDVRCQKPRRGFGGNICPTKQRAAKTPARIFYKLKETVSIIPVIDCHLTHHPLRQRWSAVVLHPGISGWFNSPVPTLNTGGSSVHFYSLCNNWGWTHNLTVSGRLNSTLSNTSDPITSSQTYEH